MIVEINHSIFECRHMDVSCNFTSAWRHYIPKAGYFCFFQLFIKFKSVHTFLNCHMQNEFISPSNNLICLSLYNLHRPSMWPLYVQVIMPVEMWWRLLNRSFFTGTVKIYVFLTFLHKHDPFIFNSFSKIDACFRKHRQISSNIFSGGGKIVVLV